MFCPNCGTKNEGSAEKCSQCGFDMKAKAAAAKFKGTMMLKGSPLGPAPTATPGAVPSAAVPSAAAVKPKPNLKGTMVGVAPPGMDDLKKQLDEAKQKAAAAREAAGSAAEAPAAAKPKPNLKGTMVGVAPPGINAMREAQKAASQAQNPAAPVSRGPLSSQLKGTMIGVAPPDMSKEVEAAKAKLAAQKAAAASAKQDSEVKSQGSEIKPQGPESEPQKSRSPSQLKGTMIGVAPPDMMAEIAKAKAASQAALGAATIPESPGALRSGQEEKEPPSAPVNPLGGTMVGTSPFFGGGVPEHAQAQGGTPGDKPPDEFSEDTPPAGTQQEEETRRASTPDLSSPSALAGGRDDEPLDEEPLARPLPQQVRLPIAKSNTGPVVLLLVLLVLVVVGVLLMKKDKGEEATDAEEKKDASAEEEAQTDKPAPE